MSAAKVRGLFEQILMSVSYSHIQKIYNSYLYIILMPHKYMPESKCKLVATKVAINRDAYN